MTESVDLNIKAKSGPPEPIVNPNPIKALLLSRKFLLAVVAVINTLVSHYASIPVEVWASIDLLLGVVIASIAYEDGNK